MSKYAQLNIFYTGMEIRVFYELNRLLNLRETALLRIIFRILIIIIFITDYKHYFCEVIQNIHTATTTILFRETNILETKKRNSNHISMILEI